MIFPGEKSSLESFCRQIFRRILQNYVVKHLHLWTFQILWEMIGNCIRKMILEIFLKKFIRNSRNLLTCHLFYRLQTISQTVIFQQSTVVFRLAAVIVRLSKTTVDCCFWQSTNFNFWSFFSSILIAKFTKPLCVPRWKFILRFLFPSNFLKYSFAILCRQTLHFWTY